MGDAGAVAACERCGTYLGPVDGGFVSCACVPAEDRYVAKRDQGKPRPSLIPWGGLRYVIEVAEFGIAKGYKPHSWRDVPEAHERYREALLRHALDYAEDGESRDVESGLLALAHIAWNSLALLALRAAK